MGVLEVKLRGYEKRPVQVGWALCTGVIWNDRLLDLLEQHSCSAEVAPCSLITLLTKSKSKSNPLIWPGGGTPAPLLIRLGLWMLCICVCLCVCVSVCVLQVLRKRRLDRLLSAWLVEAVWSRHKRQQLSKAVSCSRRHTQQQAWAAWCVQHEVVNIADMCQLFALLAQAIAWQCLFGGTPPLKQDCLKLAFPAMCG